jgi:glutaredoxin
MDSVAERVLKTYDELRRDTLDLHTLFELAGGNPPAQREAVLDTVTQLVRQGLLREGDGDFYTRTEDGRLAVAGPRDVTLYTRPGCHLCDEAKAVITPLLRDAGATLREVNIDDDPVLRERYTNDVPVIFLGSRKVAKHRVDAAQFRRQLADAAKP